MPGNSIGRKFVLTIFGESHGLSVGVIINGCPAGLPLSEEDVQKELDKRRPGVSEVVSSRVEEDKVQIFSGIFNGKTTGAPIGMLVWNKGVDSTPYDAIKHTPRPGHADFPVYMKYGGLADYRGGGRFSGRMTVAFVMAGAVAKKLLATCGVETIAHTIEIGGVRIKREPSITEIKRETYQNPVRCADPKVARQMARAIKKAKKEGDSVGGIVEGIALNVPVGVGCPIFDSLDADLAKLLFDIPAVKGVEFGAGFEAPRLKGSENNDQYGIRDGKIVTLTNKAGGILGGLSSGMPITVRVAFKPTPSIRKRQKTVDLKKMTETTIEFGGKHDPCIVPRAVPVVESVLAIVLADHMMRDHLIPKVLK